jgi:hypothetical protein
MNAECGMRNADLIRGISYSFHIPHSAFRIQRLASADLLNYNLHAL